MKKINLKDFVFYDNGTLFIPGFSHEKIICQKTRTNYMEGFYSFMYKEVFNLKKLKILPHDSKEIRYDINQNEQDYIVFDEHESNVFLLEREKIRLCSEAMLLNLNSYILRKENYEGS